MNVDPNTAVRRVAAAFPAARDTLQRLGLDVSSSAPLYEACEQAGIRLSDVQAALAHIDWTRVDNGINNDPSD